MATYENALSLMNDLFGKDYTFVLVTSKNSIPSARVVDTYYDGDAFWVVAHAGTTKVKEIEENPHIALCNNFYNFKGKAINAGHPLNQDNEEIRKILMKEFEPWYFAHNNEEDTQMCYIKITPQSGYFHKDGIGYHVNFIEKTATEFPFTPTIKMMS